MAAIGKGLEKLCRGCRPRLEVGPVRMEDVCRAWDEGIACGQSKRTITEIMTEAHENLRQLKAAEIRQSIEDSRRDDRTTPADEVIGRLEAKYTAMMEKPETQGDE